MIKEAIEKILGMAQPEYMEVTDAYGRPSTFASRQVHEIKAAAPELPDTVQLTTLEALKDLVNCGVEGVDPDDMGDDYVFMVKDHETVSLISKKTDIYGRRTCLATVKPVAFEKFIFGQWIPQENFVIALNALFVDGYDKNYVLEIASSLTQDASTLSEDDGFSQKVNLKAGLRTKEVITIKGKVVLAPYRTFPEVMQVPSEFVFRARANGDQPPQLALFAADGGRWKQEAAKVVAEKLNSFELGIAVIH